MICPICKKKMIEKKALNKPLYYCSACIFLTKGKTVSETLEKNRYDSHVCDAGYLEYMQRVFTKIEPYIKGNKILDFGCGKIHALANILKENNYDSFYYDKYYFANPLEDKYSTIILIEVIEHILDVEELFTLLLKHLDINGRLIIMTNFIPSDISNWWYLRDITHINFYSITAFKSLAKRYGFKLVFNDDKSLVVLEKL